MYCPKCKSENIVELEPTIIRNTISGAAFKTWDQHDQELIREFPAFNFQCQDCGVKFCVDSK